MIWNKAKQRQDETRTRVVPAAIDNRAVVNHAYDATCKCHGVNMCPAPIEREAFLRACEASSLAETNDEPTERMQRPCDPAAISATEALLRGATLRHESRIFWATPSGIFEANTIDGLLAETRKLTETQWATIVRGLSHIEVIQDYGV